MYHQATASVTTSGTRTTVCKPLYWTESPFKMNYDPSKRPCPVHTLRTYEQEEEEGTGMVGGVDMWICMFVDMWIKEIILALRAFEPRIVQPVS